MRNQNNQRQNTFENREEAWEEARRREGNWTLRLTDEGNFRLTEAK